MSGQDPAAVTFDGVTKVYRRGAERTNVRAAIPGRFGRRTARGGFEALSDVSLTVAPGEILGVIGPNGAGKSTMLKLIARTIAPTRGRVQTVGRIASLIELGVGFHPDLTGADNVRFSAALLGMSRRDIASRYDQIVEFAGIEAFMGTPVKRYSSGMLARLGFAVAAHLDAEILLVDEVLSVGDVAFQRRGFERMRELQASGATLLLVSHNLLLVPEICGRAVQLKQGRVVDTGDAKGVVERYVAQASGFADRSGSTEASPIVITEAQLSCIATRSGQDVGFRLVLEVRQPSPSARATVVITTLNGVHVAGTDIPGSAEALLRPGSHIFEGIMQDLWLRPDTYRVLFTVVEQVQGVPLTLDQSGTSLLMEGDDADRQYGSAYLKLGTKARSESAR